MTRSAGWSRLRGGPSAWLCILCACVVSSQARASLQEEVVVERVLATVDGVPVLLSDVRVVERVRGIGRDEALRATIDERLMFQEASRLAQASVTQDEADAALKSLPASARAGLEGLHEAGLRRLARRQAAILKYVEFRFRPQVRVTDEALHRAYESTFGERPDAPAFEATLPELRAELERRQLDEKIEAWIKDLRAAAEVRLNGPEPQARP